MKQIDEFFATARERHNIYLRRSSGASWPWTDDPVMRQFRLCNVFRELDRTTIWFKNHVREPMREKKHVLLATVLFRWFNRIETGEAIFTPIGLYGAKTAWDVFRITGETDILRRAILRHCGDGPYVTGSYIINGKHGMNKLDGVLSCIGDFFSTAYPSCRPGSRHSHMAHEYTWRAAAELLPESTLERAWDWLRQVPFLGDFMAYEVVSDLRHTNLLCTAPDINTWANPGPGAARGLARVSGRGVTRRRLNEAVPKTFMLEEMRWILNMSRNTNFWPATWAQWEMREVEHWLCEFDKISRVRAGEGRPRGVYRQP